MLSPSLYTLRQTALLCAALLLALPGLAGAVSSTNFASVPPTTVQSSANAEPLVMLLMGKDQSLYKKAYTDVTDVNGDGVLDTTYLNSIDYYGYFDPYKCYSYDATNKVFVPQVLTTDHYCTASANKYWSGNFLNWATMTRMDVLRKVLYGGYRSTDTATQTVLERTYIPTDAHSFAKFYNGADLAQLTPYSGKATSVTMCNTTYSSSSGGVSQTDTDPPLMRVAAGDFRHWAANERWQCTWDGERGVSANTPNDNDPDKTSDGLTDSSGGGPDYVVRVEACVSGALKGTENCEQYPNGDLKPVGLLHAYGESGKLKFGLMTGSYQKNKSGGVLRKNISDFSNEVNAATDGTFTGVDGIVKTINALRIHGYKYSNTDSDGKYNDADADNCPWGISTFTQGNCSNWGNPMTEMYLEAVRYFAGKSATSAFNADDTGYIAGLKTATWSDPLSTTNWCAKCSIIVLNTGPFSYDSNQLGMTDLTSSATAAGLTQQIGNWENITGNSWFVGQTGTSTDQLCTPKTISDLSQAQGPCPDAPRLGGSYDMAGIAYWAHTNDIRALKGSQTVNTYAVSLGTTAPVISIPVPGDPTRSVKLIPACRDDGTTPNPSDCTLVDVQITTPYTLSGGTATGDIYVNWEDSEQGGDYDQDMWGTIHYSITGTDITITTSTAYQSTSYAMGFGYVISGTTMDGFHAHSGIHDFSYTDPYAGVVHCTDCNVGDAATSQTYMLGTSTAGVLKDPLWYTAKYGGFLDLNPSHTITSVAQWDNRNNTTNAYGADGQPDNYFTANNPGQLAANLGRVLANISERVSSGTATAVIANAGTGTGMLVQALYQPAVTNSAKAQRVTWVGMMHSLFLDAHNNLREDSNQNGQLDDYATDKVVTIFYDATTNQTEIARYDTTDGVTLTLASVAPLSDLKPIWNARDQLAALNNGAIPTQRGYNTPIDPTHGRYIITAIDSNGDGVINNADVIPFTDTAINSTNFGWMDIQTDFNGDSTIDAADADQVVDYVRGEEGVNANFRSRTIDYDQDNVDEVWRLGDIVNSTPLIVGAPGSAWDSKYADTTYTQYRSAYANRRVVVYTGANDGMLHAFNGGFFDAPNKRYVLTRTKNSYESADPTSDPLGSELWAYVPSNLLPHLQWLTEPDYPHVYYVDGTPQAFDVNIFPAGVDSHNIYHPNGWGTILVVGMRLGGGPITYTPAGSSVTSRSAYVIMDITDPEQPPVLLGEISDPALGFATSTPSLLVKRTPGAGGDWSTPATNNWYLVFGSGPTDLATVTSAQNAKLYILDLKTMGFVSGFAPDDLGIANSFVGDTRSVDWTNDFSYDTTYFGIVGGGTGVSPSPSPNGRLMRLVTDTDAPASWTTSTVINPNQPFPNRPEVGVDEKGKWWVYAGTGRLYVPNDNLSTDQQSFYGIKEQVDATTGLPASTTATRTGGSYNLQNTTGVQVFVNGAITDTLGVLPATVTTFNQLVSEIDGMAGWYLDLPTAASGSTRNLGPSTMFRLLTLFTSYTPSTDSCIAEGSSSLYAVYYKTGTAYPNAGLGNVPCSTCSQIGNPDLSQASISVGTGVMREVVVVGGGSGGGNACTGANCGTVIGGTSTGAVVQTGITGVPSTSGRQSWREIIPQ